jgi:PAS domain S-box-containing protein
MVAQRDDGTTFPVLSSANLIFNDHRQPTGVVAFFRDMTRLEQTEDSLKAVYERVAEGVILHDDRGTILAANPYICTLLGYAEEDLFGRNAVDLVPEAEKQQVQKDFASLTQDESLCTEHLLQTQSGGYIVTEIYAKRLRSNLVVGMHRDITTRKQEEQEKKDAHRILRHDLKGMINTVINLTRLIRDEAQLAKRQRDILDFIEGSGHSMREVMDTYMRIFTNEENTYEVRLEPLDLAQYTANALENHSRLADSKNVRVDLGVPETSQGKSPDTIILADPTLCRMMLNNLILNALEAVPSDGTLAIRMVSEKERVRITLRNEGSVPDDIRPRFGEKYATSKEFGTGLGVYSAKVMTQVQNGTFTWRSDNSYTTIELTFQAASHEIPFEG